MQSLHKKNKFSLSKSWIYAEAMAENRRKWEFRPTGSHLYHYAGNNPITYTDPNGEYAGLVLDRVDANGMGHIGLFVQTGDDSWSYFEVYPFDKNGEQAYHHIKCDDTSDMVSILSKNRMSFPCGKIAELLAGGKEAGVIQRDFSSKDVMMAYFTSRKFSEILSFETTTEQDSIIYNNAVSSGKDFSGYSLIGNNCGTWAMNVLSTEGSGINKIDYAKDPFKNESNFFLGIYMSNAPNGAWLIFCLSNPEGKTESIK